MFSNRQAQLEAIETGHQYIGHDRVWKGRFRFGESFRAVLGRRHTEAKVGQVSRQKLELFWVVVNRKHNSPASRHTDRSFTGREMRAHRANQKRGLDRFEQVVGEVRLGQFCFIAPCNQTGQRQNGNFLGSRNVVQSADQFEAIDIGKQNILQN